MAVDDCPLPSALEDISNVDCVQTHDQILKVAFVEVGSGFIDAADYDTQTSWTTRIAAADVTKMQISPFLVENVTTAGTAITYGGDDNTTVRGVQLNVGEGFTQLTFQLLDLPENIVKELREYPQMARGGRLAVVLIGDDFSYFDGATPTSDYFGIPVSDMFVQGWKEFGGLTSPNKQPITLNFAANTADRLQFFKHSNFNPATLTN